MTLSWDLIMVMVQERSPGHAYHIPNAPIYGVLHHQRNGPYIMGANGQEMNKAEGILPNLSAVIEAREAHSG